MNYLQSQTIDIEGYMNYLQSQTSKDLSMCRAVLYAWPGNGSIVTYYSIY
jgi:hypothetical protein